jgi:hypothetical protein
MGWPSQSIVTSYGPPLIADVSEDRAKIRKAAMFSLAATFIQVGVFRRVMGVLGVCVCVAAALLRAAHGSTNRRQLASADAPRRCAASPLRLSVIASAAAAAAATRQLQARHSTHQTRR